MDVQVIKRIHQLLEFFFFLAVGPIPIVVDLDFGMLVGIGHDGILFGQFGL